MRKSTRANWIYRESHDLARLVNEEAICQQKIHDLQKMREIPIRGNQQHAQSVFKRTARVLNSPALLKDACSAIGAQIRCSASQDLSHQLFVGKPGFYDGVSRE